MSSLAGENPASFFKKNKLSLFLPLFNTSIEVLLYSQGGNKATLKAEELTVENQIKVTNVSVFNFNNEEGKLKGVARVVLGNAIQLTGLRIYEGSVDLFVSYPSDPYYKGEEYRQLFYPVSKELRDHIQEEILAEYHKVLAEK